MLRDVSLVARPGTVTALVGPSGRGKSTLARLIMRFYDVDEGAVGVSGVDVREAGLPWLLSRVAIARAAQRGRPEALAQVEGSFRNVIEALTGSS
ncbi:hypothetical protein MANAM107_02360 [Actinomyces capricornis]|uniref:ABC transporter domain-containing protein n=1 Tax=Actinomyces capricornis TaxID=2755559 RepID=A0ABM7U796_9ACTO|nr:hypothetical protein MANAM107_02360 [Actinomyces capricornis]